MDDFEILCICTGNVCRSPVAERLLAGALGPGVRVVSAGTGAPVGAPIAPQMGDLLLNQGIDASDHRARWLTESDVKSAGLVLGMAREHRGRAVELAPAALRRSFTLLGLAEIARHVPRAEIAETALGVSAVDRLRALAQLAPRYRQLGAEEDITDPIGLDGATYARVFAEIAAAASAISEAVSAAPGTPGR